MFRRSPTTQVGAFLLDWSNRNLLTNASDLAEITGAPDPNHHPSKTYRKTLTHWEKNTLRPEEPVYVSRNLSSGNGSLVACLSCLGATCYLSRPETTTRDSFINNHTCN